MAKTWSATAAAAAAVAFSVLGASGRATAAPAAIRTVVLHVSDLAGVSERDRTEAEQKQTKRETKEQAGRDEITNRNLDKERKRQEEGGY